MSTCVQQLVDQLAEAIVFADPHDCRGLGVAQQLFDQLSKAASQTNFPRIAESSAHASQVISQTGDSQQERDTTIVELGRLVTVFHAIVMGGLSEVDAAFPTLFKDSPATVDDVTTPMLATDDVGTNAIIADPEVFAVVCSEIDERLDDIDRHILAIETDESDTDALGALFRAFHTLKGLASYIAVDEMETLAHETENLLDAARNGDLTLAGESADTVFASADAIRRMMGHLQMLGTQRLSDPTVPALIQRIRRVLGTAPDVVDDTPLIDDADSPGTTVAPVARDFIRVDAERLDRMINIIGEMVIQTATIRDSTNAIVALPVDYREKLDELGSLTRSLQAMSTSVRMVPVRRIFEKMSRTVRDLAKNSGKSITLVTEGIETEIDRKVADMIGEPLLHMVRNAVDHGIESTGTIWLRAAHRGARIVFEIEDDGRGLDRDRIIDKAVKAGIITAGAELGVGAIYNLIFESGLSTAETVSSVSGRGVGMDVVKQQISEMNGDIVIESSPGRGTLFRILLPLRMGIVDGMTVRVGRDVYIVPLRPVVTCLDLIAGSPTFRGQQLPLIPLQNVLHDSATQHTPSAALVVEDSGDYYALGVDSLIGQEQVVVKRFETPLRNGELVGAATIMPDGSAGLVLDTAQVIAAVKAQSASKHHSTVTMEPTVMVDLERLPLPSAVLTFTLDGLTYGADISRVIQVSPPLSLTRLPGAPAHVCGVVNLTGRIVTIVDLRLRFGLQPDVNVDETSLIIVEIEAGRILGLVADDIRDVVQVAELPVAECTDIDHDAEFLLGIADGRIRLLNLNWLLLEERALRHALKAS